MWSFSDEEIDDMEGDGLREMFKSVMHEHRSLAEENDRCSDAYAKLFEQLAARPVTLMDSVLKRIAAWRNARREEQVAKQSAEEKERATRRHEYLTARLAGNEPSPALSAAVARDDRDYYAWRVRDTRRRLLLLKLQRRVCWPFMGPCTRIELLDAIDHTEYELNEVEQSQGRVKRHGTYFGGLIRFNVGDDDYDGWMSPDDQYSPGGQDE